MSDVNITVQQLPSPTVTVSPGVTLNGLTIGTVTTLAAGSSATATITGTAPNQLLNIGIPLAATDIINIGTITTLSPGASATATITGTAPNLTLNLGIPQGATGSTAGVSTNTPSTVVQRDSSGNFAAGTITANLAGNVTGNLTGTPISPTPLMYRNRLINGGFAIDQRNAGASHNFAGLCGVDRWLLASGTGTSPTAQRIAGSGSSRYRYQISGVAGNTGGGSLEQRIEAANIYDLAGQTVTFSIDIAAVGITSIAYNFAYANSVDNFIGGETSISGATGSFTVSSTLTRYSVQIALPSNVQNGLGVGIIFGGAFTAGKSITIGNAQLEAGSVATPFEQRLQGAEVALCQRYFQNSQYQVFPASTAYNPFFFKATMRATPSVSGLGAGGTTYDLTPDSWRGSQTTGAVQTLSFNAEL